MAEGKGDSIDARMASGIRDDESRINLPPQDGDGGSASTAIMPALMTKAIIDQSSGVGENSNDRRMEPPVQPRQGSCSWSVQPPLPSVWFLIEEYNAARKADPKSRFHIRRRLQYDTGNNYKPLQFPDWLSTDVDVVTEILVWLSPHMMIRAAASSRFFKDIILSNDFRSRVRRCEVQTRLLLGLFGKSRENKPERYPFLECSDSSIPLRFRSASFSVWCSWKPNKQWGYVELLDSRDGRLLLFAGENRKKSQFVIFYPQCRNNLYSQLPRLPLLSDSNNRLVTAALVPDDKGHDFTVIALTRRGVAVSGIKSNAPTTEASVVCFTSSNWKWSSPVTASFQMPAKSMLRLGSLLLQNTLYFLQPCEKVITVDISTLELGIIKLPDITTNVSRTAHVLAGSSNHKLYLAIASGRDIFMYCYDGNNSWNLDSLLAGPGTANSVIKLAGSTEMTGLIFLKVNGQMIYKMDIEGGKVNFIADNMLVDEVLPYEMESPPVSPMLRQQQEYYDPVLADEERKKGNDFFKQQKYSEAVEQYTEALRRTPKDPEVYSNRASCYTNLGTLSEGLKDDNAVETYQDGLKHDPSNQELLDSVKRCIQQIDNANRGEFTLEEMKERQEPVRRPAPFQAGCRTPETCVPSDATSSDATSCTATSTTKTKTVTVDDSLPLATPETCVPSDATSSDATSCTATSTTKTKTVTVDDSLPLATSSETCVPSDATSSDATSCTATSTTKTKTVTVDDSLPSTSLQIRFADGSRLVARFNTSQTIGDVRAFIDATRPGEASDYTLQVGFPPKLLDDVTETVEEAGVGKSVIFQRVGTHNPSEASTLKNPRVQQKI